jgi:hypothetical protein
MHNYRYPLINYTYRYIPENGMPGKITASPVDAQVHGFIKKQAQRESCTIFHILDKGG